MTKENLEDIFRLKRKWQIALRRYVVEEKPCPDYAKYFGLPIYLFREWISMQFTAETTWDNFGKTWQFVHILPVSYFDFTQDKDLLLCWNFCNISIEILSPVNRQPPRIDLLAAKQYFERIYMSTAYSVCKELLEKIDTIEKADLGSHAKLELFILKHKKTLGHLELFSRGDFERVNWGLKVEDVIAENQLLAKFGK